MSNYLSKIQLGDWDTEDDTKVFEKNRKLNYVPILASPDVQTGTWNSTSFSTPSTDTTPAPLFAHSPSPVENSPPSLDTASLNLPRRRPLNAARNRRAPLTPQETASDNLNQLISQIRELLRPLQAHS